MADNVGIDIGNRILKFIDWRIELDLSLFLRSPVIISVTGERLEELEELGER